MKVFLTVGTTPFDKLMKLCDNGINSDEYELKGQISDLALYIPSNFEYFFYTDNIKEYYDWADVVIAHAGSGTLFQLLELNKKCIFVPNNIHKDNHQNDLCRFVKENNYSFVLDDHSDINQLLKNINTHTFEHYKKEENDVANFIYEVIFNETDMNSERM